MVTLLEFAPIFIPVIALLVILQLVTVAFVEFIKNNTKNFSFRTLNTIFDKAANSAYNQSREVAMTDLFEALKDLSKELDINPMALNKFINSYT